MSGLSQIQSRRDELLSFPERNLCRQIWMADWKRHSLPYCSIYVIAPDGHWPCKIGISVYARKRINQLQTSHWKRLEVARCFWVGSVFEARRIEKKAHQILKDDGAYLLGEWFDKTPEKAEEVIEFAAMLEGIDLNREIDSPDVLSDIKREWSAMAGAIQALNSEAVMASVLGFTEKVINSATGKPVRWNSRY